MVGYFGKFGVVVDYYVDWVVVGLDCCGVVVVGDVLYVLFVGCGM